MAAEQMVSCLPDGCRADSFSLLDSTGADGFSFFNGLHCLRVIPMKIHTWFPDCLPPMGASVDDLVANNAPLGLCWSSLKVGPCICRWGDTPGPQKPLLWERWWWGPLSIEASAILMLSWALTWDEVSTGLGRSFSL